MTDMTITQGPYHGILRRLRLRLPVFRRPRTPAAHLDTLSDRMLRDIGIQRVELDHMRFETLRAAMLCARQHGGT